jgi:hypothetical protein
LQFFGETLTCINRSLDTISGQATGVAAACFHMKITTTGFVTRAANDFRGGSDCAIE